VAPHLPKSVPPHVNLRYQQVCATVEQVDREEERSTWSPIAAIVRHAREYALENGGMRSRFSALRLLRLLVFRQRKPALLLIILQTLL
jgi:hypothetical protein